MEIIIVILIIGILSGLGMHYDAKRVRRSKIDVTAQTEQLFAADMDTALSELGAIMEGNINETSVQDYLNALEDYLTFTFDRASLQIKPDGFIVNTAGLTDGFDMPFAFYMSARDARAMLISGGADTQYDTAQYATGNFGDDIIITVKERK